ncbi:MAG: signal peptidase II [Phycisphaerae bacterium]|jgi:signal peptidase II
MSDTPATRETSTAAPPATTPRAAGDHTTAFFHVPSQVRFWLVAALGLTADLWSKAWAFGTLGQRARRVLIPHVLELQTMMNDGALFGIGSGRTMLFLVASVLALGLVLWMFAGSSPRSWLLHVAFGAILAGAAGNMYDRVFVQLVGIAGTGGFPIFYEVSENDNGTLVFREYPAREDRPTLIRPKQALDKLPQPVGHVRDFIKIPTRFFGGRELWPWVFNVADMLLVGGVAILGYRLWRDRGSGRRPPEPRDAPAAGTGA